MISCECKIKPFYSKFTIKLSTIGFYLLLEFILGVKRAKADQWATVWDSKCVIALKKMQM